MDATESAYRFQIYRYAFEVLAAQKHLRAAMIDKHPHSEKVKAEVMRLHEHRRGKK